MIEFDEFVAENYRYVLRTVALVVGDHSRAEDAVQDALLKAFRKWRSVQSMSRPEAWVLVVAINADRRRWRRLPVVVAQDPEVISLQDHAEFGINRGHRARRA